MWDVTGWAVATWLKTTTALVLAVTACWWLLDPGVFVLAVLAAAIAELYVTRQLAREWTHEAGLRWWWSR